MSGFELVCKKRSNGSKCSTTFSADSKDQLLEKALDHYSSVHEMKETTGLKQELKASMRKSRSTA